MNPNHMPRNSQRDACESEAPEWDGDGLPPVGTVCEGFFAWGASKRWRQVEVLRHSDGGQDCAVYVPELHALGWVRQMRPIRSEEDKAIDEMIAAAGLDPELHRTVCRDIYRAIKSGELKI